MSEYFPDNWVVLKITHNYNTLYKVLAGWSGGYLGSDSWRMNSGIVDVEETTDSFIFIGHSGSRYICNKTQERLRMNTAGIWKTLQEEAEGLESVTVELMEPDNERTRKDWKALIKV